jgi:hypothetical protein
VVIVCLYYYMRQTPMFLVGLSFAGYALVLDIANNS